MWLQFKTYAYTHQVTEVEPSSYEYRFISALFLRTANEFIITQIMYIRNDALLHKFNAVKETMDMRDGTGSNEMQLFHGTSSSNIDAINMGGLNRSYTTTHLYGKGVYFARNASYSARRQRCKACVPCPRVGG